MPDKEKVIKGLELCTAISQDGCLMLCPYKDEQDETYSGFCEQVLKRDALALLKEQEAEHRRLLSWLGKFCRHIDNGDVWLTDEENIAFFKEKMKQQFGWDTD